MAVRRHNIRWHPRLHLEYFPSYAPELNPDEGVWSLAKRDLANGCPLDADELMDDVSAGPFDLAFPNVSERSRSGIRLGEVKI